MADFGKLNFSVSFNRTSAFPLEANSYFNNYTEAELAALTAVEPGSADSAYYIGLTLTVADETDCNLYIIKPDLSLKRLTILDTSDVAWESILNKPTTIGGYGIIDAYTKTESDNRYVNVSGDTMTGPLIVVGKSTSAFNSPGIIFGGNSGRIGTSGDNNVGIFAGNNITLRPGSLEASSGKGLCVSTTVITYNDNIVWHAGNDGSGSGLDADLLDGKHYTDIVNGNVASATKLQTPRTIWGQSFDGTANVSGELFGAGGAINIEFTNEVNSYDGDLFLNNRGNGEGGRGTTSHIIMCNNGGNVGIGTTNPSCKLHVSGTASISDKLYMAENTPVILRHTNNEYTSGIGYDTADGECMAFGVKHQKTTFKFKVGFDWETFGHNTFANRTDSELEIGKGYVSMSCGHTSQSLKFENNNEINSYYKDLCLNYRNTGNINMCYSGGNVAIGTLPSTFRLDVNGTTKSNAFFSKNIRIECGNDGTLDNRSGEINNYNSHLFLQYESQSHLICCMGGGNVGIGTTSPSQKLHVVGNVLATGFYEESDVQLKTNIQSIDFTNNIELVSFNWKKDGSKSYGVIAQQVELYYPELVSTDESTGYKSVNYDAVLIIKCALLENRIKQLEKELEDLKNG